MPYSVPTPPPSSLSATPAGSPPAPMRSLSTQAVPSYSFSSERGSGAFAPLRSLPRRGPAPSLTGNPRATSATAKRFHIKSSSEDSSSSSSDDNDHLPLPVRRPTPVLAKNVYIDGDNDDARLPPLKLRIDRLGSPSFNGVPFPRSSPLSSPLPGASSPFPSPTRTASGLLSPLSELNLQITGHPTSPSTELPISASNPIYSPYKYSPQDGTALPLPLRPSPTRSSSSPHLSNGRPLKSSLKSSSSASSIHSHTHHTRHMHWSHHQRASSAPSTPGIELVGESSSPSSSGSSSAANSPTTPKSVHFPSLPTHLERVHVFHKSAKPASLLAVRASQGEETETETETDRGGSDWGGYNYRGGNMTRVSPGSCPFPTMHSSPLSKSSNSVWPPPLPVATSECKKGLTKLELDMTGYPVPDPTCVPPNSDVHILLESVSLSSPAPEDKIHLQGSFIVRNLAFTKDVCVRFTMDEWSTVSEIRANWVANFPSPFSTRQSSSYSLSKDDETWDRFSFSINLSDYTVPSLPSKVIYFVGRYTVPGAEYWDNCRGRNWRVGFKTVKVEAENSKVENKGLVSKTLPVSDPTVSAPTTSLSYATATNSSSSGSPVPSTVVTPPSPSHFEAVAHATAQRLRRFSLSNYVAPGSSIPPAVTEQRQQQQATVNPKNTKEESLSPAQSKDTITSDEVKPSPRERLSIVTTPTHPSVSNPHTPPTEVNEAELYDWFVQQWCFAGPSATATGTGTGAIEHDTSSRGTMGLEIGG